VYDHSRYDPRPADIWSIAIVFCCMTLRRFPWKAPRVSDNSYRLFVAPPDPEQDQLLDTHRKSVTGPSPTSRSGPASRNPSTTGNDDPDADRHHHHHHHHHHQNTTDPSSSSSSSSEPVTRQPTATDPNSQPTIKGPARLLRLLPRETRHIVGRMLELDPRKRATMEEVLRDPWVQNSLVCRQEENGVVIKAPNHTHTLQPSGAGSK